MNYFDLHCDTITELYDKKRDLGCSFCHVSRETISKFEKYVQVTAVFSKTKLTDDEAFERFASVCKDFTGKNGESFVRSFSKIEENIEWHRPSFILSVEDARLLSGDIGRLQLLLEWGVKLITPLWSGETCIGGAFDTDSGLSPFGKRLCEKMIEHGIICDVSHASRKSTAYILDACAEARIPAIASHSNSFSAYGHPRNLTDGEAERIAELGGIIGISLAPQHLAKSNASMADVTAHIDHYRTVVSDEYIAFGCDFDGIDTTPIGLENQGEIPHLRRHMQISGYKENFIEGLFFGNAFEFFKKNFK